MVEFKTISPWSRFFCIVEQLHLDNNATRLITIIDPHWINKKHYDPRGQPKRTSLSHSVCHRTSTPFRTFRGVLEWRFPDFWLTSPESALEIIYRRLEPGNHDLQREITPHHHHITAYCLSWLLGSMFSGLWPYLVVPKALGWLVSVL